MRDEWEYLVRLNVKGEFVMRVWADDKDASERMAYDQMREVLPGWCAIQIEGAKKADPPSMRYFLRDMDTNERCLECHRVFDLMDETDAQEFYYGHDCEAQ